MKFQAHLDGYDPEWHDIAAEQVAAEFWNEGPGKDLQQFMDDYGLDVHTAALYTFLGGGTPTSRRGGRFRLIQS
ncbi:MAG: hypothetical protein F4X65_09805 [Chloroflexi bacterium]|nr:hypothetical protein [Chloroflexota bacterium]